MTTIREIPAHLTETFWPLVAVLLSRALRFHPHLSLEALERLIARGLAELIVVLEGPRIIGAVVMEVQQYPDKRVGNVVAVALEVGALKTHGMAVEKHLEQWCRERQLDNLAMYGAPGWVRFVQRHGWKTQRLLAAWKEL